MIDISHPLANCLDIRHIWVYYEWNASLTKLLNCIKPTCFQCIGILFVVMLVINLFLCSAMSCSCGRSSKEKEASYLEDFDPYARSWQGSQYGSRWVGPASPRSSSHPPPPGTQSTPDPRPHHPASHLLTLLRPPALTSGQHCTHHHLTLSRVSLLCLTVLLHGSKWPVRKRDIFNKLIWWKNQRLWDWHLCNNRKRFCFLRRETLL